MSGRAAGERDPARVVAFSDGVIAIAVTLLVLDLRAPANTSDLVRSLAALWPSYVSYVITFMLVAQVWANHHVLFDHIRQSSSRWQLHRLAHPLASGERCLTQFAQLGDDRIKLPIHRGRQSRSGIPSHSCHRTDPAASRSRERIESC